MNLLITGSNGQLGWELCSQGKERGIFIVPLDLPEFDITDEVAVKRTISEHHPDLIINSSAYTAVDKAESEQDLTFSVNSDGPSNIAAVCAENNIPLIHISTDYVFDGCKAGPYLETDKINPVCI